MILQTSFHHVQKRSGELQEVNFIYTETNEIDDYQPDGNMAAHEILYFAEVNLYIGLMALALRR